MEAFVIQRLIDGWRRMMTGTPVPAYVLVRPAELRQCPECGSGYAIGERYCPGCRVAVPEWRFG
jgi:hypothetical protein